ncbi:hypothetical protein Aduo_001455 [Ancylostoma duodenale]
MDPAKCAVKSVNHQPRAADDQDIGEIPVLGAAAFYKHLGAERNTLNSLEQMCNKATEAAAATTKRIMDSELTVHQKAERYNQIVIPKLTYVISCMIFGTGEFASLKKKAREFDIEMRKLLAETHLRFGHSCAARTYVRKEEGGSGLKSAEEEVEHGIIYTWCSLATNADLIIPYQLADSLRASNRISIITDFHAVLEAHILEGRVL